MNTQEVMVRKPKRKLGTLLMAGLMATGVARIGGSFAQRVCNDYFSKVTNHEQPPTCVTSGGGYTWTGYDPEHWTGCGFSANPASACFTDPIPSMIRDIYWTRTEQVQTCDFNYAPTQDFGWQSNGTVTTATPFPCLS